MRTCLRASCRRCAYFECVCMCVCFHVLSECIRDCRRLTFPWTCFIFEFAMIPNRLKTISYRGRFPYNKQTEFHICFIIISEQTQITLCRHIMSLWSICVYHIQNWCHQLNETICITLVCVFVCASVARVTHAHISVYVCALAVVVFACYTSQLTPTTTTSRKSQLELICSSVFSTEVFFHWYFVENMRH